MTFLFAAINRFRDVPQGYPKTEYALGTGPGGGDGMTFVSGAEVFVWNTNNVPSGLKPRHLSSLSVDTTGLTAGKNLIITIGGKTYTVAAGNAGFTITPSRVPFEMRVSTNGGTGTVFISAYDYGALFTGAKPESAGSSVASPAGQGGSGVSGGGSAPFGGSDIGPFGTDGFGPL